MCSTRLALVLLVTVLLGAAGLRAVGFARGEMQASGSVAAAFHHYHPDEATLLRAAAELDDPLNPPLTAYGLLPIYLARVALEGVEIATGRSVDMQAAGGARRAVLTGRALALLLSIATLLVLAAWAWVRFGRGTALLAVALCATPPLALQDAHFYTVDGLFALLFLLVLWATAEALASPTVRGNLLVGLLVGLAGAVRLNGLALGLLLAGGHLLRFRPIRWDPRAWLRAALDGRLWLAGGAALMTVLVLQPWLLAAPERLTRMASTDDLAYSLAVARGDILRPWTLVDSDTTAYLHFWTDLWPQSVGWPLTLLLTAGLVWGGWRGGRTRWLLVAGSLLYFLPVGGLHSKHVRYLLPMLAPLCLLAADLVTSLAVSPGRLRSVGLAAAAVAVAWTGLFGIAFTRIYREDDARTQAAVWLENHAAPGETVLIERGAFVLPDLRPPGRNPTSSLDTGVLFQTRGYRSCACAANYLSGRLVTDWAAVVDVNRARQYMAVPSQLPVLASFYETLLAGGLGYEPVKRFKVTPQVAGIAFPDDGGEPSFLGFDHPAVHVLRRSAGAGPALGVWRQRVAMLPACPDGFLQRVATAVRSGQGRAALDAVAAAPADTAPGLLALLESRGHGLLGDTEGEQAALDRYTGGYGNAELAAHLLPWAAASSLVSLELPELAVGVLRAAVQHKRVFREQHLRAMSLSYVYMIELLAQTGRPALAAEVSGLALKISPEAEALDAAARLALNRGDIRAAVYLWQACQEVGGAGPALARAGAVQLEAAGQQKAARRLRGAHEAPVDAGSAP